MFKKILIVLFLMISLSACAEPPGPELSTLPEEFIVEKAQEERTVILMEDPKEHDFQIEDIDLDVFKKRDYILMKEISDGLFQISLYLNYDLVCKWGNLITDPHLWKDTSVLYFSTESCPNMKDSDVEWHFELDPSYGVLYSGGRYQKEIQVLKE